MPRHKNCKETRFVNDPDKGYICPACGHVYIASKKKKLEKETPVIQREEESQDIDFSSVPLDQLDIVFKKSEKKSLDTTKKFNLSNEYQTNLENEISIIKQFVDEYRLDDKLLKNTEDLFDKFNRNCDTKRDKKIDYYSACFKIVANLNGYWLRPIDLSRIIKKSVTLVYQRLRKVSDVLGIDWKEGHLEKDLELLCFLSGDEYKRVNDRGFKELFKFDSVDDRGYHTVNYYDSIEVNDKDLLAKVILMHNLNISYALVYDSLVKGDVSVELDRSKPLSRLNKRRVGILDWLTRAPGMCEREVIEDSDDKYEAVYSFVDDCSYFTRWLDHVISVEQSNVLRNKSREFLELFLNS